MGAGICDGLRKAVFNRKRLLTLAVLDRTATDLLTDLGDERMEELLQKRLFASKNELLLPLKRLILGRSI